MRYASALPRRQSEAPEIEIAEILGQVEACWRVESSLQSTSQRGALMFTYRKLACSFCGKSAAEVSKLVAGPKVFICDVCAAEAHRIMSDPSIGAGALSSETAPRIWRRVRAWFVQHGVRRSTRAPGSMASARFI
jgi:hypothetical protein